MENKNQEGTQSIESLVVEHIHKGELKSSIENGSASKTGVVKLYYDPNLTMDQLKGQVDKSIELLAYLKRRMEGAPAEGKKVSQ